MRVDIIMPQLGESVVEGTITKWLVKPGDTIQRDQAVVEVATDKADSEVPAPQAGKLVEVLFEEGATVKVGQPLCVVETEPSQSTQAAAEPAPTTPREPAPPPASTPSTRAPMPSPTSIAPPLGEPTAQPVDRMRKGYTGSEPVEHAHSTEDTKTFAPRGEERTVAHPASADAQLTTLNWQPPARETRKAPPREEFPDHLTSPAVRRLAMELSVDLSQVQGTGERARVTRDDVLRAAGKNPDEERAPGPQVIDPLPKPVARVQPQAPQARTPAASPTPQPPPERPPTPEIRPPRSSTVEELQSLAQPMGAHVPPIPGQGYKAYKVAPYVPKAGDQVVPFTRRRRLTADHMVYSKQVSPHVMTIAEIDMHKTSLLREQHKAAYAKDGTPLTMLTFICAAAIRALREFPGLNARVLEDSYVLLHDINLGIAVDTPAGLVVPNIKHADDLSMRGLARAINEMALKARDNKLTPDDLSGGTFSITNPGAKGNLVGAAVISQPNVGILRTGSVKKRPVVVEHEGTDSIAIHPVMYMALSYDHRIVDGVLANSFLWRVTEILEKGDFIV